MKYSVQYSGGIGSFCAAERTIERYGRDSVELLFSDTKTEDEDLYRFLDETEEYLGVPITRIADGRDVWQVFDDEKFIGNTRIDPCSKILKRQLLRRYLDEHYGPDNVTVVLGIDWSEEHRFKQAKPRWKPYELIAPMCERPLLDKAQMLERLEIAGIRRPRLYDLGFAHNNCGGFCVKQGQAGFVQLLKVLPERFAYHADQEAAWQERHGKEATILRDRTMAARVKRPFDEWVWVEPGEDPDQPEGHWKAPPVAPLSLHELRRRVEEGTDQTDPHDIGGCSCVA